MFIYNVFDGGCHGGVIEHPRNIFPIIIPIRGHFLFWVVEEKRRQLNSMGSSLQTWFSCLHGPPLPLSRSQAEEERGRELNPMGREKSSPCRVQLPPGVASYSVSLPTIDYQKVKVIRGKEGIKEIFTCIILSWVHSCFCEPWTIWFVKTEKSWLFMICGLLGTTNQPDSLEIFYSCPFLNQTNGKLSLSGPS